MEKGIPFYDAHFKLYLGWNNDKKLFLPQCFPTDKNSILFALKLHDLGIASNFKAEFVAYTGMEKNISQ